MRWCENLPRSIIFSVEPKKCECENKCTGDLPFKWTYKNGVYPGHFESVLGKGGEGIVVQGSWHGKDAAFKFTPVKHTQKYVSDVENFMDLTPPKGGQFLRTDLQEGTQEYAQEHLERNLNEVFKMQATVGSAILKPYGHFRFVVLLTKNYCQTQTNFPV